MFHVFFSFSTGLKNPITVPPGFFVRTMAHVDRIEKTAFRNIVLVG